MQTLYIDTETFNTFDIKVGTYRYCETVEVTLFGYVINDQPAQVWDLTSDEPMPEDLSAALADADVQVVAHNVMFDRNVLRNVDINIPITRWRCNMVKAYSLGLPGSLEQLGHALGLAEEQSKRKDGKRLVRKFCKPAPSNHKAQRYDRHNCPEEWEQFIEYCRQDVETLRHIWQMLPNWNYEVDLWHLDQVINDRGLPIDMQGVRAATAMVEREVQRLKQQLRITTEDQLGSTSQVKNVITYLRSRGLEIQDLTKATVTEALKGDLDPIARRVLEIRQQANKTSTAKYNALHNSTNQDDRLRGTLQFYGASRTGRWAGRVFQPQNLPRPEIADTDAGVEAILNGNVELLYDNPMAVASSCIRSMIKASTDRKLVVSDLSGIEARVLPWLAGDDATLDIFRDGRDIYKDAASGIYHVDYDKVDKAQRFIGKVASLALGYQGGPKAFITMGKNYGVEIAEEEAVEIVQEWRRAHHTIRSFWHGLQDAAMSAIEQPGRAVKASRILATVRDDWLTLKLPSGRFLCYYQPEIQEHRQFENTDEITFMGVNQFNRKWERISTYGGKLVENVTQAVARDVLAHNLSAIEQAGYQVVTTIHDEVITEAAKDSEYNAESLSALLATVPEWAEGLPLGAEGYESARYRKD